MVFNENCSSSSRPKDLVFNEWSDDARLLCHAQGLIEAGVESGLCEHYVEFDQLLHENKVVVQGSHILFGSTLENRY